MTKIVGVWRTHVHITDAKTRKVESHYLTHLYYVTDSIPEQCENEFFGMVADSLSLREDNCSIIGLNTQDWGKLVGCEVEFGCRMDVHGDWVINKIFVLNAPEQEDPADE